MGFNNFKWILLGSAAVALMSGCTAAEEDIETSLSETVIEVSGTFNTSVTGAGLSTSAIDDYSVYCVTLESTPQAGTSAIDSAGAFSLEMPANTAFGCFVTDTSLSVVATIVKTKTTDSAFGADAESSYALEDDMDMGTLDLNLTTGQVEVPEAQFADAEAEVGSTAALDVDEIHNNEYTLSCVETPNAAMNAACAGFVQESPQVFLRVLKGTEDSEDILGWGVWASQSAFEGCGSIDLSDSEASQVTGITFSQIDTDTAFTDSDSTCERRDDGEDRDSQNIESYFTVGPISLNATGLTFVEQESHEESNCTYYHFLSLNLVPGSGTSMIGTFDVKESSEGSDCSSDSDMAATFTVNFTLQE